MRMRIPTFSWARCDNDGRFAFVTLTGDSYAVRIELREAPQGTARVQVTGAVPSHKTWFWSPISRPSPVFWAMYRADSTMRPDVTGIRLRFELKAPRSVGPMHGKIEGHEFEFSREWPGQHGLIVLSGETPVHVTNGFDLAAGEQLDLGTLTTQPSGDLQLTLLRGSGVESAAGKLISKHRGHELAGHDRATTSGQGLAPASIEFELYAGRTAAKQLELELPR
ncbi:MAG: hypothetical protein CMJ89_14650 [Planctomycetes bacterium]|nr:hypothetical protein [Planctomycetota bacterium]